MSNQCAVEDYLTFPVKRLSFQALVVCRATTEACDLMYGIRLVHRETTQCLHLAEGLFTLGIIMPDVVTQRNRAHQHRLVRPCMVDTLSLNATAQCSQTQARRDL